MRDILQPLFWLLGFTAIAAIFFRNAIWLRIICVALSVLSVFGGMVRLSIAPRIAVDQLKRENLPWSESFRDGSLYTYAAVQSAFPIFLLSTSVLATLALVPSKRATMKKEQNTKG